MPHADVIKLFNGRKVMVLGDLMLDHYIWGKVERISPEAPVPVLEASSEEYRLGGAANVALNLKSMGAEVSLIGIHGSDDAGSCLEEKLKEAGLETDGLLEVPGRRTTQKTRIASHSQQIVRVDSEDIRQIDQDIATRLISGLKDRITSCEALIIEDYDKGLLTPFVIDAAIGICRSAGIPVAVDPKLRHFFHYRGVDIFKPNYSELQRSLGRTFDDESSFLEAAADLRRKLEARFVVLTRGAKGMYVFSDGPIRHLPTAAREVYDVSGAGDTVISALTLSWICGAGIDLAAEIANHAAGVVCGKLGTASVNCAEILDSLHEQR